MKECRGGEAQTTSDALLLCSGTATGECERQDANRKSTITGLQYIHHSIVTLPPTQVMEIAMTVLTAPWEDSRKRAGCAGHRRNADAALPKPNQPAPRQHVHIPQAQFLEEKGALRLISIHNACEAFPSSDHAQMLTMRCRSTP